MGVALVKAGDAMKEHDSGNGGPEDALGELMIDAGGALIHLSTQETPQRKAATAEALQVLSEEFAGMALRVHGDVE
jgi:hypothetical protein